MATALVPRLTRLDERVRDALPDDYRVPGVRARTVAARVGRPVDEVREILRGLEHVGLCLQAGGWWHRGMA